MSVAKKHIIFDDEYYHDVDRLDQAKATAMLYWDTAERRRVHTYNFKWAVFSARLKLLRHVEHLPGRGVGPNLAQHADAVQDLGKLVELRLCFYIMERQDGYAAKTRELYEDGIPGGIFL